MLLTQVRWLPWQGASVSEFAHGGEIDRKYAIAPLRHCAIAAKADDGFSSMDFQIGIFKYGTSNMEPQIWNLKVAHNEASV